MKTIEEMIQVMTHFKKGGKVEIYTSAGTWDKVKEPNWNWHLFTYRIKPSPKVIPWTFENAPLNLKIKFKNGSGFDGCTTVVELHKYTEKVYYRCRSHLNDYTLDYICEKCTQLDGSPCGSVVKE